MRDRCREDMNNPYYSVPQSQSHHHHLQQQSVATSTADNDQMNINNNINNSLVISPSQTTSSTASATSNQQQQTITPSLLYTVQRVVSTTQLQQLQSNYGNTSNASSLTSIIARNETDCGVPNNNGESLLSKLFHVLPFNKSLNIIIDVIAQGHKNVERRELEALCCGLRLKALSK